MNLFEELQERGFIEKTTSELVRKRVDSGDLTFYVGYDPSADSLHIGNFALLSLMRILQKHGHSPIGLMGGATGMIGDPGGRSTERNLLTKEQLASNIAGIKIQLAKFLDFEKGNKAIIVNNHDWLGKWSYLDFLRDVGKHFSVNAMVGRESVKNRLDREGGGISYTEFSYMLLQAYDFYFLYREYNCELQFGGSDQWGNIVSGIELTRRLCNRQVYGATIPLITKADGTKFGKSEGGAVWLDAKKTSPYEFYQYFLNQADEDIVRYLKIFTQLELEEIQELERQVETEPHKRAAQKRLAEEVTRTVHGQEELDKAVKASAVLFGERMDNLDDSTIASIFKDVPSLKKDASVLRSSWSLVDALVETEACRSRGQARKLIRSGGVYLNNAPQRDPDLILTKESLASDSFLILRTGKKSYRLVQFQ